MLRKSGFNYLKTYYILQCNSGKTSALMNDRSKTNTPLRLSFSTYARNNNNFIDFPIRCEQVIITHYSSSERWIDILHFNSDLLVDKLFQPVWNYKWSGILLEFSIDNPLLTSTVESKKLPGVLDSCYVLFGTLQQCAQTEPQFRSQ